MASAQWEKRNARARALGYASYYDYRAHGYGQSKTRATGERLRSLRGHASLADLERLVKRNRVTILIQEPEGERDEAGRFSSALITAQLDDGSQRTFRLRGKQLQSGSLEGLRVAVAGAGIDIYVNPSLDVFGLRPEADVVEEAA